MNALSSSLVLFDIDGTLLRGAGRHHKDALIEGIRKVTGRATSLDGIDTSGMLDGDLISALLRANGECVDCIGPLLRSIIEECQNAYAANCTQDLSPFVCVSVPETLQALQARGAVLGLVTGNFSAIGWRKMELAGLRSYFSLGAFAEDAATRAKLASLAVRRAKEQGLVAEHCRVSLVGDHANDILAAKENGFQAVAVGTGIMPFEELQAMQPHIAVRSLTELDIHKLL